MSEPEFLTQREFAAILRVSVRTVKRWVALKVIQYWQAPRSGVVRIPRTELERHVKENCHRIADKKLNQEN